MITCSRRQNPSYATEFINVTYATSVLITATFLKTRLKQVYTPNKMEKEENYKAKNTPPLHISTVVLIKCPSAWE